MWPRFRMLSETPEILSKETLRAVNVGEQLEGLEVLVAGRPAGGSTREALEGGCARVRRGQRTSGAWSRRGVEASPRLQPQGLLAPAHSPFISEAGGGDPGL